MKLLTLNAHSKPESCERELKILSEAICDEQPDVIALQEVCQTRLAPNAVINPLMGGGEVKEDNFALRLSDILENKGKKYNAVWKAAKIGYDKYDEGLALFLKKPVKKIHCFCVSRENNYNSWKTRIALGAETEEEIFFSLHFGRWDDEEDPFSAQWERFNSQLENIAKGKKIWLMGDFNAPADICGESYDAVLKKGFSDSFAAARVKTGGATVKGKIDGWQSGESKRIDFIFSSFGAEVKSAEVIFSGENREIISDHFGVLAEI